MALAKPLFSSDLFVMIRGEYYDMPGLSLTARQGARLWNLNVGTCEGALDSLVSEGFLVRTADMYLRAYSGAAAWRHAASAPR